MTAIDQSFVTRVVEAALLASHQPLSLVQLKSLFPLDEPIPDNAVEIALHTLQETSTERGVALVEVASGWRFQVQADVHPWVARLWSERQTKYTRATLETLALIAYRQPITRGEIEQIRGVTVNSNIIKALEERDWIRVVGHRDVPGKPELLATTRTFLDYFGLKRLDELPPLSELRDIGELEPQLPFEPTLPVSLALPEDAPPKANAAPVDTDITPLSAAPDSDVDTDITLHHDEDSTAAPITHHHEPNDNTQGDDAIPASSEHTHEQ